MKKLLSIIHQKDTKRGNNHFCLLPTAYCLVLLFTFHFLLFPSSAFAQFAPPAGQLGSTAIYKDSAVFVAYATGCTVVRGEQDITNPALGYASAGDSSMALGIAGTNGVVSLGDGGYAIVTFDSPIKNADGWDFAVFENSFSDTFLELAFVEVSSDGINYFRFPATSYTQDTVQIAGFGSIDATKINNLAGKYRALYGTPFDLQELAGKSGLDINNITHVKIIDVVGCIQNAYATHDQYGNKINDPWNTPFASSGFDLDAVGVFHNVATDIQEPSEQIQFSIFPNPAKDVATIHFELDNIKQAKIILADVIGNVQISEYVNVQMNKTISLNISHLSSGIYFFTIMSEKEEIRTKKISINNN